MKRRKNVSENKGTVREMGQIRERDGKEGRMKIGEGMERGLVDI